MSDSTPMARDAKGRLVKGHVGGPGRPKGQAALEKLIRAALPVDLIATETEVRERFRILNERYNWFEIALSQEGFPDFILKDGNGQVIRAEAEVYSVNFRKHKHDAVQCDLIICWEHNWENSPIPVLTISVEWLNYLQLKSVRPLAIQCEGPTIKQPMAEPQQLPLIGLIATGDGTADGAK